MDSIMNNDINIASGGNTMLAGYIANSKPLDMNEPAHIRAYKNQWGKNRKPLLTNQDFSEEELDALRQAVYNKRYEQEREGDFGLRQKAKLMKLNPDKYMGNNIGYENYDNSRNNQRFAYELNGMPNDVNSSMASTIGTADYTIDNNGNVILRDRYDFNQPFGMKNVFSNLAHAIGYMFGNPYNIQLNLGNPNEWRDFKYTGNDRMGIVGD